LKDLFGEDLFDGLVPSRINSLGTLQTLLDISRKLQALRDCHGFREHVSQYKTNASAAYFVTSLAYQLLPAVDSIGLEPGIPGGSRRSDILALLGDWEVFIECKQPFAGSDFYQEHRRICDILLKYIVVPHQVSVHYKRTLPDKEVEELGARLGPFLESVSASGTIMQTDNVTASVVARDAFGSRMFEAVMPITTTDLYTRAVDPGHVFFRDGKTLEVAGPRVDEAATIARLVKRSRAQSPKGKPYVLAISAEGMLGTLSEQITSIRNAFQPAKNTRFSGVLLTGFPRKMDEISTELTEVPELIWLSNPFAQFNLDRFASKVFATKRSRREGQKSRQAT